MGEKPVKRTHLIFLITVAGVLLSPLVIPGFPQTHDGYYHLVRTAHLIGALKQGIVFPSWAGSLNESFGSIVFLYNWLLPYYAAASLGFIGFSIITATKL